MSEKLQLKTINDKVYLYYGEKMIFQNSKSMPFIVLKKNKNGVETTLSLFDCKFEETENGYKAEFFGGGEKARVSIVLKERTVGFKIECDEDYDELSFTLQRNGVKVYGLPAYKQKKYRQGLLDRIFKREPKIIELDKKLSFYLSSIYLFENVNITDYVFENKDNIFIKTRTRNPSFNLIFADDINVAIKTQENVNLKIKQYPRGSVFIKQIKYNQNEIDRFCTENNIDIKGIVIDNRIFDPALIKPEIVKSEKKKYDIIYSINKVLSLKIAKKYFDIDEYEVINDSFCKVKLSTKQAVRKYLVVVRKYLDLGASGIYFDGDFTHEEILNIKEGMKTVVREYLNCVVFHSTINESSEDFGYFILKNQDIIKNFHEYSSFYLYSSEIKIGKEESKLNISDDFYINIINFNENKNVKNKRKIQKK